MAARVTDTEVKALIDVEASRDITSLIDVANRYVDKYLLPEGLTTAELKDIELYLAAHLVALTVERGGLTSEVMGDSEQSYANVYKSGFRSTRFGQMAITLDSTGILASVGSGGLRAEFKVL